MLCTNFTTAHSLFVKTKVNKADSDVICCCQDDLLRTEISRLKSRLSQQEHLLSGAVKRLRTTNQLKEGMERVIIDQRRFTPHDFT